jgi:hypothetical protein
LSGLGKIGSPTTKCTSGGRFLSIDQTDVGLAKGITRISIRTAAHGRPIAVTLWQSEAVGTRIESVMHDLAERIEVGVLVATRVSAPFADEVFVDAPSAFNEDMMLTKLFIEVETKRLESGVVLRGRDGCEIVIVAGAFPYSLAVLGIGEAPHRFEPEYPLNSYLRLKTE